MSELSTLARPYASAIFKRACETGTTQQWSQMLGFIATVVKNNEIVAIIKNPKVSKAQLVGLIQSICQGQLTEEGANFLKLAIHNNRLMLSPQISAINETLKAQAEGYIVVDVKTAYAFTEAEVATVTSALQKILAKKVHLNLSVDLSLLGGFLAKAGDKVIDGSIKGRLQQLAKQL
jgi:F-type H+-transporting ATPase subunit delta